MLNWWHIKEPVIRVLTTYEWTDQGQPRKVCQKSRSAEPYYNLNPNENAAGEKNLSKSVYCNCKPNSYRTSVEATQQAPECVRPYNVFLLMDRPIRALVRNVPPAWLLHKVLFIKHFVPCFCLAPCLRSSFPF